jgi:ferrous iron transporter FeoB
VTDTVVALVGNPNCGKTTLFNALTGARQRVGNWPGVTVEKKTGRFSVGNRGYELVDLPGIYSLHVPAGESAIDEQVSQSFLSSGDVRLIVDIVDASNPERNFYLTAQLIEMQLPMVIALNMVDVAADRQLSIDADILAKHLGCPVVPIVASRKEGIEALKAVIDDAVRNPRLPSATISYPGAVEKVVEELGSVLSDLPNRRRTALGLLEGDAQALKAAPAGMQSTLDALRARIEEEGGEEADILIAAGRYAFAHQVVSEALTRTGEVARTISDRIDRIVLNRAFGIPIFLAIMYAMFMFTINFGGAFIDFFDILFGTLFVDGFASLLGSVGTPDWLTTLLANGVGGGIQTVATFVPVIACLFLFLSVLEDSGYMARAAFVMDRCMRFIGLPGKSFVPLIVGFGCNVPAIMAARTLENQRDRTLTMMMAPFMSCGARLPVYALFAAAFFPVGGQNLVFLLYLTGILVAVLTGLALKSTLLRGETSPFIMELPPYHVPTLGSVLIRTWDRLKSFVVRAGRVIIAVVVVLSFLNSWGPDGSFGNEDSDASMLASIGRGIAPVFTPMGLNEDNWPATVGIFTGILAKEAVVGTLDSLYTSLAERDAAAAAPAKAAAAEPEEEAGFDVWAGIAEAFATIPQNLTDMVDTFTDPLGIEIGDVSSVEAAAEEQEVTTGTFGAMVARFDGTAGAFAYLLLVLLYMPCVAAIAAVYRETNWRWTMFICGWTTMAGYAAAVMFFQAATFSRHPTSSAVWIAAMLGVIAAVVATMRYLGRREDLPRAVIVPGT